MTECPRVELAPGYSISTIINGCWQLTPDHGGGPGSEREARQLFSELADSGFTTFDCADIYTGVEEALGTFRRSLDNPERIQIHTKYAPNRSELHKLSRANVDAAIDRSLQRLGVERLDLLQFHWWDYGTPGLDEASERLIHAQKAGKIRLLGVTNFDTGHVRRLVDGGARIVSLQTQYSLLDRRPEKSMLDLCAGRDIRLLPYGVLAGGFMTDAYSGAAPPLAMNRSLQKYRLIIDEIGGWEVFQRLLAMLAGIADKHGTSIAAVATRWVLDQPAVAAVILGVGSKSRVTENLQLGKLQLDEVDHRTIAEHLRSQIVPPGDMYDLERDPGGPHVKIIKTNLNDAAGMT